MASLDAGVWCGDDDAQLRAYSHPSHSSYSFKPGYRLWGEGGVIPPTTHKQASNMDYKTYLTTEDWRMKRNAKLAKTSRCGICGSKEHLDVHHLNYKDLYSVTLADLRVLCRRCHFLGHELHRAGKLVFTSENHHSRFALFKHAVKTHLGLAKQNLFSKHEKADLKTTWHNNI